MNKRDFQELRERWERQGLSDDEIDERFDQMMDLPEGGDDEMRREE